MSPQQIITITISYRSRRIVAEKWQLKNQSRIIKLDSGEVGFLSFFVICFEGCHRFYNEAEAKEGGEQNGV